MTEIVHWYGTIAEKPDVGLQPVLAIPPNIHSMQEFVKNLVLTQVRIVMECTELQKIQIFMEQSSTYLCIVPAYLYTYVPMYL